MFIALDIGGRIGRMSPLAAAPGYGGGGPFVTGWSRIEGMHAGADKVAGKNTFYQHGRTHI